MRRRTWFWYPCGSDVESAKLPVDSLSTLARVELGRRVRGSNECFGQMDNSPCFVSLDGFTEARRRRGKRKRKGQADSADDDGPPPRGGAGGSFSFFRFFQLKIMGSFFNNDTTSRAFHAQQKRQEDSFYKHSRWPHTSFSVLKRRPTTTTTTYVQDVIRTR